MKFWQLLALVALCCATVLGSTYILSGSKDVPRFEMREFDGVMVRLDRETGAMATCWYPNDSGPRCYAGSEFRITDASKLPPPVDANSR